MNTVGKHSDYKKLGEFSSWDILQKDESWSEDANNAVKEAIFKAITAMQADPSSVRRGKWVKATGMMPPEAVGVYECSVCGRCEDYHIPARLRERTPFCPWCGAKLLTDDEIADGIGQAFSPD